MKSKRMQRRKEDFVCENCKESVKGDGYTDHCPKCLWSKHVDINPGDRSADCGGMMRPEGIKKEGERVIVYYRCLSCGFQHRVRIAEKDNLDEIIKISKKAFQDER